MLPVLQLTRGFFGINEADDPASARQKIAGSLVLLDDSLRDDILLACDFLGVADPEKPLPPIDAAARERRLLDFVKRLMEARSANGPALLLFDDLHWIDEESERFIAQLMSFVGHTRTFVLGNQRPEYDPPWKSRPDYQQISLSPLGSAEATRLAGELLGDDPSVEQVHAQLLERAEGNPFFTEELVRELAESGALDGVPGDYRCVRPIGDLKLPATVGSILAARIDRLDDAEKRVLQTAAVIGREMTEPLLLAVAVLAKEELSVALGRLGDAGLLIQRSLYPVAEYTFRHPLTHEVAYRTQLAARRAETHALVAKALEKLHPDPLDEQISLLAHHWDLADDPEQATHWHRRAAISHSVTNPVTSLRHWQRVRERLGESESESTSDAMRARIEACSKILYTAWNTQPGDDDDSLTESAYLEGIALAEELGDDAIRASLVSGMAGLRGFRGEHRAQITLLEQAFELVRGRGDFAMEASLHQRIGWSWGLAGETLQLIEWSKRGVAFCERDLDRSGAVGGYGTYAFLLSQLGWGLAENGEVEEAQSFLDRSHQVVAFTGDQFAAIQVGAARSWINWIRDDRDADIAHLHDIATQLQTSDVGGLGHAMLHVGRVQILSRLEDWLGALESLNAPLSEGTRISSLTLGIDLLGVIAHWKLGEPELAESILDTIRTRYERNPSLRVDSPLALLRWAEVHRLLYGAAAREEITTSCDHLIESARTRGFATYEPFALVERAELSTLLGDQAGRERDLAEAARLFRGIGAVRRAESIERS
jgi:adenylate cyclase